MLYNRYDCNLMMTSGSIDTEITNSIRDQLSQDNINCVVIDNTPIRKVAAVIRLTDLYITNDTGTMHVAGGVDANVISLFGPTHGYEWAPTGENKIYIQSSSGIINDITVDEVFAAACKLIESRAVNINPALKIIQH
mgnify:CR=1 FL=1